MEAIEQKDDAKQTSRIEAFSDGVFAIAITLLVLDIHVPTVNEKQSLLQALLRDWATYLAFLVGFFTILICWINHHYIFEHINKSNDMMLLINGVKLLVVSFTPFVTALLAKYIQTPHQSFAVSIYAGNFVLMGCSMSLIWNYGCRNGLTKPIPRKKLKASTQLYTFAGIASSIIFLVSFATTLGSLLLSCIMFLIFLFPKKVVAFLAERNEKRGQLVAEPN